MVAAHLNPENALRLLRKIPPYFQYFPCTPRDSTRHGVQHDSALDIGRRWRAGHARDRWGEGDRLIGLKLWRGSRD